MEPITVIDGDVTVLDRDHVDTDQIIPKQFLKRVERTGFGEFLFYDWAKEPGWDLPANPILATGANFGSGSSREHARGALPADRATVLCQSLTELVLDEPVDAVFSNAVFHWVPDHELLFARLRDAMKPGARLIAQYGGEGNVA